MKRFMDENFLLNNNTAEKLYHDYAAAMPIIDYHCHLNPKEIADDIRYENLTRVWLYGDHYKWRAMRSNGVDESYCTGNASDWEKFEKWAETVPYTLRNPLYHWTHLELQRYFNIYELLSPSTARDIYDQSNALLASEGFSARGFMIRSNVKLVCTTDDPVDTLEYHQKIKSSGFEVQVLPTWRPDKAMAVENPEEYNQYLNKLEQASNINIKTFDDLMEALQKRHEFFHTNGCRLSDHGIETFYAEDYTQKEIDDIFSEVRSGKKLPEDKVLKFKSAMLVEFGIMDHSKGWTQQFHAGAMRNNNSRLFGKLGADTGFDSIGDFPMGKSLSKFLDQLDKDNKLTKTILYNLNPVHNELIATMIGNFQDGTTPGKIQFGSGWWFLDQKDGMEKQMNALSALGLLSRFVGMLTDSRSFLSYPRHEYFRRILCNLLGTEVEKGELPNDIDLLGRMVQDICYNNAATYFGFDL